MACSLILSFARLFITLDVDQPTQRAVDVAHVRAAAAPFHEEPMEAQRVWHSIVYEVDLLDRNFEGPLSARAIYLVIAHLALLPVTERKLHLAAAAELRIARVEDAAEARPVVADGEE